MESSKPRNSFLDIRRGAVAVTALLAASPLLSGCASSTPHNLVYDKSSGQTLHWTGKHIIRSGTNIRTDPEVVQDNEYHNKNACAEDIPSAVSIHPGIVYRSKGEPDDPAGPWIGIPLPLVSKLLFDCSGDKDGIVWVDQKYITTPKA